MSDCILVTGGTGFLGRHLLPALCRKGYRVRLLTRNPQSYPWLARYPRLDVIKADIVDKASVMEAARGCRYVIHAAGMFRFWGDSTAFERTNVGGTENMLKAAAAAAVDRVIHISTIALIGHPEGVVDETHPAHPADAYQRSKLRAEEAVTAYHQEHGLPVIILRPGAYYGPLGHYAFNRLFFRDPMRGIIMQVNGGRYITFPVYIADVVQGVLKSLDCGTVGAIYNICGDSLSHKEAFDIICEEAKLHFPRLTIPGWLGIATARALTALGALVGHEPFWPITLRSYVYNDWRVSTAKARRELSFAPTDFRTGARRTIAWYRAGQPDAIPEVDCEQ